MINGDTVSINNPGTVAYGSHALLTSQRRYNVSVVPDSFRNKFVISSSG